MKRIAKKLGKQTLTGVDIDTHGRISARTISRKFGTMQRAHKAAGLVPSGRRSTYAEMLKALVSLWTITMKESGRSPIAQN